MRKVFRKVFGPKSVAGITSSLRVMMDDLLAHKEAQYVKMQKIQEKIDTLTADHTDSKAEAELAEKVHANLKAILV